MSQYFDMLKDLGLHSNQNTILIPHSPSSMNDLFDQMRNAIITGNQAVEKPTKKEKVKAD
jgi:hypothetical protein